MFKWLRETAANFFEWLQSLPQWWLDQILEAFEALWLMAQDVTYWLFEQLLDLVFWLIGQLDFSGLQQYTGAWGTLPAEIINVLGLLGIGDACIVIIAAIGIRLVLQLIPFTRLGS